MGLGRMTNNYHSHGPAPNQINWLVHSWSSFGARMSHGQT